MEENKSGVVDGLVELCASKSVGNKIRELS